MPAPEYRHTNPDAKLPVDNEAPVPPAVAAAARAAEAAHAAAYQTQPVAPPAPIAPPVEPPAPIAPPVEPPAPVAPPAHAAPRRAAEIPDEGAPGSYEHRYHAMKGRYDQSQQQVGSLQGQLSEMGDELMRVNQLIQMNPQDRQQAMRPGMPSPGQAPRRLLTDDDVKTYGPELIDFVKRAANEAVAPALDQTQSQVRQVSQRVGQTAQAGMMDQLGTSVPDWQPINVDPRFKAWCGSRDIYSGQLRGKLLNAAFQAADAPRVIAFFKGFLNEEQATGQLPVLDAPAAAIPAPREAAVSLDSLAAPGRPKPAGGDRPAGAADKPVFTRVQIASFYTAVRQGAYNGRQADKDKDEAAIFAAQREGRVRG